MPPTTLLTLMLATYAIPIAFVYYKYSIAATATRSISSIITSKEPSALNSCLWSSPSSGSSRTHPSSRPRHFSS